MADEPVPVSGQVTGVSPVTYQVISESTVRQKDGSTIIFRQVVPPQTSPQAEATAPVSVGASAQTASAEQVVKETTMLSISASVHANGQTVLHWTCGASQRMYAVSNVDFRYMEGIANLQTNQSDYFIILSAGADDQQMSAAEVLATQLLPQDGSPAFALVAGSAAPAGAEDEAALDALGALLDYYDSNKDELVALKVQRDADRAARELAARNAPPPPPRNSIVHFWPMQAAQRAAIMGASQVKKGEQQP